MFKDEEEVLERCIQSVEPYVSEFVLYDTGSTDSSVNIASMYSNKVHLGKFTDFVETKNKVLDIADKSKCDWVLWMDADEYLQPSSAQEFQETLKNLEQYDSLVTDIQDVTHADVVVSEYIRPRIWRNHKGYRFNGPGIHEYIEVSENRLVNKSIKIGHKHKTRNKNYTANFQFYLDTLHKYEQRNPKDLRCLFYLGRTYYDKSDFPKAIEYHERYQNTANEINYIFLEEYWYSILETGRSYKNIGDFENAIKCFESCISHIPERAEAYKELGNLYYYNFKDLKRAKEILEKSRNLEVQESFVMFTDLYSYKYSILDTLSLVYYEIGEFQKGLACIDELLALPKINQFDANGRIRSNRDWFIKDEQKPLEEYKEKFYDINTYFDNVFLINLESRPDRLEKVSKKLKEFGIHTERFRGYDGKLLEPFVDPNILVRRTGGYIGCLLSHLEIMKISQQRGYDKILILEDDLGIRKDLNKVFMSQINELERNHKDWDCVYFGHANFTGQYRILDGGFGHQKITYQKYDSYISEAKNTWACHAIAFSKRMINELLTYYKTNGYHYEIDRLLASEYQNNPKFKTLLVYPELFIQNDLYSDNDVTGYAHQQIFNNYYSSMEDFV